MSGLLEFVTKLCDQGEILLRERPRLVPDSNENVLAYLSNYHDEAVLNVAGTPLPFDPAAALAAAELAWWAAWYLVSHDDPPALVEERVRMPAPQASPSAHFSADLVLRYLTQLHGRANARSAGDVLSRQLATVLRQWPLSGVLADVTEPPLTPVLFDEHRGLLMLYAERWNAHPKPLWRGDGLTAEYCVWIGEGKD